MAHQKKEKTVMTRIKISDLDFVKKLADEDGISISDKLSEIIHQWASKSNQTNKWVKISS